MDHVPEFLIDNILPSGEVHLLGGPSGAGKTTWLFQMLAEQWKLGGTILGHTVHPVPFVYISADRSKAGVKRTMARAGVNAASFPFVSLVEHPTVTSIATLAELVARTHPDTKLLIIDGMMRLVPPRKDASTDGGFGHISRFLIGVCKLCQDTDLTIIFIVHSPKQKEDSRYANPRERVMGSTAWAAFSETVILVEPYLPISKDTADCRTLIVLPRNSPAIFQDLVFASNGRLTERSEEIDSVLVDQFLGTVQKGEMFTTAQFERSLEKSMARSTIHLWLKRLEGAGKITKMSRGNWRNNHPN